MSWSPITRTLASNGQRATIWSADSGKSHRGPLGSALANPCGGGNGIQRCMLVRRTLCSHFQTSDRPLLGVTHEEKSIVDFESSSLEVKTRILEAILLISKEPLSARRLAAMAGLADPTQARTLARRLNEQYDSCGNAFRIEELAGGMQLLTRPQFSSWLRRLEHVPREELLSQGMLESLAIIAYRQPVLRAEIEAIRGVSCDEVLRQLMQRDLVRICGRHEDLGRPYLYGTTKRFLLLFGLQSLDSLPRAQKIRSAEADIASRLAGNPLSAQDIGVKEDGMNGQPPSTTVEHH